ncbi:NifB/NifX family molybdenum-iron cluster-binding protein [Vibrio olivae]
MTVRKLHLETASDAPFNPVLKVAFATHSRLMIDEHFGHARTFLIYGVDYSGHQLLDAVEFTDELAQGHNRLPDKINLLKECDAVFVMRVALLRCASYWQNRSSRSEWMKGCRSVNLCSKLAKNLTKNQLDG